MFLAQVSCSFFVCKLKKKLCLNKQSKHDCKFEPHSWTRRKDCVEWTGTQLNPFLKCCQSEHVGIFWCSAVKRIYQGVDAKDHAYPWMVAIHLYFSPTSKVFLKNHKLWTFSPTLDQRRPPLACVHERWLREWLNTTGIFVINNEYFKIAVQHQRRPLVLPLQAHLRRVPAKQAVGAQREALHRRVRLLPAKLGEELGKLRNRFTAFKKAPVLEGNPPHMYMSKSRLGPTIG